MFGFPTPLPREFRKEVARYAGGVFGVYVGTIVVGIEFANDMVIKGKPRFPTPEEVREGMQRVAKGAEKCSEAASEHPVIGSLVVTGLGLCVGGLFVDPEAVVELTTGAMDLATGAVETSVDIAKDVGDTVIDVATDFAHAIYDSVNTDLVHQYPDLYAVDHPVEVTEYGAPKVELPKLSDLSPGGRVDRNTRDILEAVTLAF